MRKSDDVASGPSSIMTHRKTGVAENLGCGAAPGAGADDRDIGFEGAVLGKCRGVDHLPACRESDAEGVRQARGAQGLSRH